MCVCVYVRYFVVGLVSYYNNTQRTAHIDWFTIFDSFSVELISIEFIYIYIYSFLKLVSFDTESNLCARLLYYILLRQTTTTTTTTAIRKSSFVSLYKFIIVFVPLCARFQLRKAFFSFLFSLFSFVLVLFFSRF